MFSVRSSKSVSRAALTPIDLRGDALLALHAAHPGRYPVLLQSAAPGSPLGRFDILLACPRERLLARRHGLETPSNIQSGNSFLRTLDEWWRHERIDAEATEVPFSGGWFLFLSYELAQQVEPSLALHETPLIACAMRIPAALVVRHADGAAWIVEEEAAGECTRRIREDLAALAPTQERQDAILVEPLHEEPPERYLAIVQSALQHIAAGEMYQANLSRLWRGRAQPGVQPYDVYGRLRRANPAPFAALAVLDDVAIVSSSPERLIEVRAGLASTRPIAGTRPRRTDRADDAALLRELHSHPKERAEHIMLIDLERNDLGRICEPGSVAVSEFMTLESYAHVHHIVSNVRGRVRADVTPGECIAAVFPGGTITGCPKVRCMQLIGELEQAARGAYTGSIGYLNRDGSMDLNILIRSIEMRGRELTFRAGAGIVADSIPERELEETRAKARGMIAALVD